MSHSFRIILRLSLLVLCILHVLTLTALADDSQSLSKGSREEQIAFWEHEINQLRGGSLAKAYHALHSTEYALKEAKRRSGWLYTKEEDKIKIKMLDDEYQRHLAEVAVLEKEEAMMLAKVKPLHGIVSRRFAQEQRDAIASAVSQVQEMSYYQAWYSSLFNIGEAETFTDLIVGFLLRWIVDYVILYIFAAIYFAFWTVPWSIYAYSSGPIDIFTGVIAWCISVSFMLLPVIALIGGFIYIRTFHGDRVAAALGAARDRERRRR